jgi:threonylcarbamoyladenosine tRNA methylthiotransferase MtaB
MNKKKAAFITLGCKVNTYETEGMKRIFEKGGYQVVDPECAADVYVINTCTVTHLSDRKSRQMIRRAIKKNPSAVIAAVGCYAQVAPEEVSALEGVNLVVGNNHKSEILQLVEEVNRNTQKVVLSERKRMESYEELWAGSYSGHTRAFLKIQDGCNQFCSYCIIPYARGGIRSRNPGSILREAEELSSNGFKEIVLTGIHLNSYGMETEEITLIDVIESLTRVNGIERIRLGSLEPFYITEEFISKLTKMKKLCPHFHLSLQSGCDETLQRMNRRYTTKEYYSIVENIRNSYTDAAVTTDIMAGFPGETNEEFQRTCDFVHSIGFSQAHIFQYSARKGTRASDIPHQIPSSVKEQRSKVLFKICEESKNKYRDQYLGRTMEVLFEKRQGKLWEGHTRNYIPVGVASDSVLSGEIRNIYLTEREKEIILGQIV